MNGLMACDDAIDRTLGGEIFSGKHRAIPITKRGCNPLSVFSRKHVEKCVHGYWILWEVFLKCRKIQSIFIPERILSISLNSIEW